MKNNQKGVTLVALISTIIVILILTSTIVINTYTGSDYKEYKLMCADIELLENKILIYYRKYGELPIEEQVTQNLPNNVNEYHEFYKINTSKLNNITLNFGDTEDIFIIDTTTFEVYYLNGIEYEGQTYYTN